MLKQKPRALKLVPFNMSKDPATETHKKLISLKHEPQIATKSDHYATRRWTCCLQKTRQSVRTADRRLCALSLTLAGPRASSVDFSYNTGFHLITAQQWYDVSVTTMCLLPDAVPRATSWP